MKEFLTDFATKAKQKKITNRKIILCILHVLKNTNIEVVKNLYLVAMYLLVDRHHHYEMFLYIQMEWTKLNTENLQKKQKQK